MSGAPSTDLDQVTRAGICWFQDIASFSRLLLQRELRPYQLEAAKAVVDSVLHGRGETFAVMMARQAGKNELSGQIEAYLLNLYRRRGGQIVKASPTFRPQTLNSILRLCDCLDNPLNHNLAGIPNYRRRQGYIVELERARALFLSAGPGANVVGATADLLLEGDEAQEIAADKWYKDFAPMAASTNATTVLYGTAWTSDTLLARTIAHLQRRERRDGVRRTFVYVADEVAACVPAYGHYVRQQVERLGRDHPLIKTQYYLEAIDGAGGLFPPARQALMRGQHPRRHEPEPILDASGESGHRYALLLDVAGEEETEGTAMERMMLRNRQRDATALTVIQVLPRREELPLYRVVDRHLWVGVKHTQLHDVLRCLADHWHAAWVVVDATGIGAGLSSFLSRALPHRVIPVVFSTKLKSDLGWRFLGAIETGRYHEYLDDGEPDTRQFWYEVEHCQYEVLPGPGERMRWGVWESPAYDGVIARGHDDMLLSAALCTILDQQEWPATGAAEIVQRADPLAEIDGTAW